MVLELHAKKCSVATVAANQVSELDICDMACKTGRFTKHFDSGIHMLLNLQGFFCNLQVNTRTALVLYSTC